MGKEFFIFRDPREHQILGYLGTYKKAEILSSDTIAIYLQPWGKQHHLMGLDIEMFSAEPADYVSWLDEAKIELNKEIYATDQKEFSSYIEKIKESIKENKLEKVVAARSMMVDFDSKNAIPAFEEACKLYPSAFVYLLYHSEFGLWLGASPEILLQVEGKMATTMALAGTLSDANENWTEKEISEQGIIGRFIENVFTENQLSFTKEDRITAIAGPLRHLLTKYNFEIAPENIQETLNKLHPTPAVGGFPQKEAIEFIEKQEGLDRGLYSGWLGWAEKDQLHTYVNLRCARIYKDKAQLFAGCGINGGSEASKEWLETKAKMAVIGGVLAKP